MASPDLNSLAATTLSNYRNTLTDNIFNTHPLLFWLKEKGRVRKISGGDQIVEQLMHTVGDTPSTDGAYGEYEAIAITPVNTATVARFDWKAIAGTVAISGMEEAKNNGEAQLVNLLEAKITQAEETLKNNLATMLFTSTASAVGGGVNGIGLLVGDNTDSVTSVGGIDSASAAYWRSVVQNKTAIAAADVDLRAFVRNAYNTASGGGPDRVDVVLSGQLAFEQYEADLLPSLRYANTKLADAGFMNLQVQGVPWMWDSQCPAGTVFGLNSKYIGLVGHEDRWFTQSEFKSGPISGVASTTTGVATWVDAKYAVITAYLELTTRNRRRNFKIKNINGV